MKPTPHGRTALFTASLSLALLGLQSDTPRGGHPPSTRAGDVKESFGNIEIADPYRWLEEQNAPETRAWIDEQNKYSEAFLRAFPGRDAIQQRVTELLKIDTIDVPQGRRWQGRGSPRSASALCRPQDVDHAPGCDPRWKPDCLRSPAGGRGRGDRQIPGREYPQRAGGSPAARPLFGSRAQKRQERRFLLVPGKGGAPGLLSCAGQRSLEGREALRRRVRSREGTGRRALRRQPLSPHERLARLGRHEDGGLRPRPRRGWTDRSNRE